MRKFLCILLLSWAAQSQAQQPEESPQLAIDGLRDQLRFSELGDEQQATAKADLDAALTAFEEARVLRSALEAIRLEAEELPERRDEMEARLKEDPDAAMDAWRERLPIQVETQTLEDLLQNQRDALEALDDNIDRVSQELVDILSGPASAAGEIATLEQRVARLINESPATTDKPVLLAQAAVLRREAELRAAQAALDLREFERDWAASRQGLYELTLRALHVQRDLYMERIEILQTRVAAQGRTELDALVGVLAQRVEELADGPEVVVSAAGKNLALGKQIARHSEGLARDRLALAESEEARFQISGILRDARIRLEVGGTSKMVGRWLWSVRQRLEDPASIKGRLDTLRDGLATLRLDEIVLSEQSGALEDIRAASLELSTRGTEETEGGRASVATAAALAPLLRQQFELLTLQEPLLRERIETLEANEQILLRKSEESLELQRLFDRYLLSAPSHSPVDLDWLKRVPEGVLATVGLARLRGSTDSAQRSLTTKLSTLAPVVVLLVVLFVLRQRAKRHLNALAAQAPYTDSIRSTFNTMLWTLMMAAPIPLALFLLGAYLQALSGPGAIGHTVGASIALLALPLYSVQVLYWTSREEGLGHRHFRWSMARRRTLRRALPAAFGIILPMYFLASLAVGRGLELSSDVLGRLAIVMAALAFAGLFWYALGPARVWDRRDVKVEPSLVRKLLRLSLTLLLIAAAWFALQGFVYSVGQLLLEVLYTFNVLVAVTLVIGFISRWLLLGERRLAASRAEETTPVIDTSSDPEAEQPAEPELSLQQINAQTGRLLSALSLFLVIGAVMWVWSEAFPAFTRLEEITLWRVTVPGVDGQPESQAITLLAVLAGIVALMVTIAGARNLPGLIEIVLASYTKVDAPSRYAITSVLRYAIVIAGTLLALSLLGMQWSRLQWLAAGLTVGLGFGLQEIFANFISGLILLFERPFRVGDIITVGELSGRVTRVRTRATTILDFDNREIVLPNKNFITGQLVNWTLSDSTTRLMIQVGVAYGTNPTLVHDLLRRAAREHPTVMKDPEPQSWFIDFGPSSLDFNLLVFVASPKDRFPVKDALNTRITELFAEHDVEIAFPQMDLHLRTLPEGQTLPPQPDLT